MKAKLMLCLCLLLAATTMFAQNLTVTGVVTEKATGYPAIGVSVLVKGTTNGTITSMDGDYTLSNVPKNATLVFSYVGMTTQEVPVNGQTVVNVLMSEDTQNLEEVVVIGYGTSKAKDLTAPIAVIKADEITKHATSSPMSALQGKVPGVQITNSGQPGSGPSVRIRGIDVKKYIYDELDYCIANLPAIRPNESEHPGAVTKYTAEMLKAKQKMYDNEWDEVLALTEDIVNSGKFELYNDFYELFKIPGKLCNESLLEYQFTDFGNGSGDIVSSDNWFAFQGPRGEAPISGWAFIEPTEKIRNLFSKRGESVRAETTFLMTDATTRDGDYIPVAQPGEPTAYNGKAYTPANQMTPGRTGYGDNNNIRVFRYADVLLMNAEAKVRKGQNGDAPLNLVRERAGLAPIANATLDQILEERQVELALEWGERFFDLVRTDRATQELPGFVKGESEYYPIPQDQIDLNPNLEAEPVPFEPEVTE